MKKITKTNCKKIYKKLKKKIKNTCPFLLRIYKQYLFNKLYFHSHFRTKLEEEISEKFNKYFHNNDIKEKIKKLKENLDINSTKEIDNIVTRYKILSKNNFINKKNIITKQEIIEQKKAKKIKLKKYPKINRYIPEVFYGISGLKWLPEKQKNRLKNKTFIDVGGYIGDSAINFYYKFFPQKIYTFEPETNNFKILLKNSKKINNIIVPIKKAVSNKIMKGNISNNHAGSKLKHDENLEKIEITTIDNFVLENKIKNIDLIKMDIEGEETNALMGAKKTISEHKPILTISIYHTPEDFFEIKPWLEELVPEYKFIIKKANPYSLILEVMLIAYIE
jgi:FkbM family methyltransferase